MTEGRQYGVWVEPPGGEPYWLTRTDGTRSTWGNRDSAVTTADIVAEAYGLNAYARPIGSDDA